MPDKKYLGSDSRLTKAHYGQEEISASQSGNCFIDLYFTVLVYQVGKFVYAQCTDNGEQDTE